MYQAYGTVIKGIGGLFTVRLMPTADGCIATPLDGATVPARGRGSLRKKGELLIGDGVRISYDDSSFTRNEAGEAVVSADGTAIAIEEILPRRSALIRPPMANLDLLFVTAAAAAPDPVYETLDKLICIAEFNRILPVLVITKSDKDGEAADRLADVYRRAGLTVFAANGLSGEGVEELQTFVNTHLLGKIAAFSGASGVGKSTLLNRIFPQLSLETGDISHRIERGKNTTRTVELYPLSDAPNSGYLADTPGFTMLDFERFHFFGIEDLPATFREFVPYIGSCRYRKCTHTKEEGCAVREAVKAGEIAPSRHASYCDLHAILKKKHDWS